MPSSASYLFGTGLSIVSIKFATKGFAQCVDRSVKNTSVDIAFLSSSFTFDFTYDNYGYLKSGSASGHCRVHANVAGGYVAASKRIDIIVSKNS